MKPVLFELTEAKRLVKHYDFLKNHKFNVGNYEYPINHILIAPTDANRLSKFIELFFQLNDNMKALSESGFNSKELQIILLEDEPGGLQIYAELNSFLTKNNIAKVYNVDFNL